MGGEFVRKPTNQDAQLLLQLEQLLLMEPNQKAIHWFWRIFLPQKIQSIDQIRKTYPSNSEGSTYLDRLSAFWESAGVLVNNGLLNEKLFFDRFWVKPYWEALKYIIFSDRETNKEQRIAEHFELLAKKEQVWQKRASSK